MSVEAVIVPKLSGLEYEMQSRGLLTLADTKEELKKEGSDITAMEESHIRQKEIIMRLSKNLSDIPIIHRDDWNGEVAKNFQVVIVPGGDNHLQYVARFLDKQILVGLNSDPLTSKGNLHQFLPEHIDFIKNKLERNDFKVEEWTRLQVVLNNVLLPFYAMSEINIRPRDPDGMARDMVTYRNQTQMIRGTSLLIATGAGLSGWARGSTEDWKDEIKRGLKPFLRTDKKFRFIVREKDPDTNCFQIGDLDSNEKLLVSSLEKDAQISFDPQQGEYRFRYDFKRGSKAIISIAEKHPLRVAILP